MKTPILSLTNEVKLRYVVNSGDTTAMVSTGFGIPKKKLMKTNQIKNSKYLTAGKNLTIILK
jgi:LysM repeat protein